MSLRTLDGTTYRVSLAPVERVLPQWYSPVHPLQAVCFETEDGRWVGSATIFYGCHLDDTSDTELGVLLRQAVHGG